MSNLECMGWGIGFAMLFGLVFCGWLAHLDENKKDMVEEKQSYKRKKASGNKGKAVYLVKRELTLSEAYMKYVYGHSIPNEVEEAWHVMIDGKNYYQTVSGRLVEV